MTTPADTAASAGAQLLSATPAVGQIISHGGAEYTTIKEGLAYILAPKPIVKESSSAEAAKEAAAQAQKVFYNPIQQFNRDLSVLAIRAYGEAALGEKKIKYEKSQAQKERGKAHRKGAARRNAAKADAEVPENGNNGAAEPATESVADVEMTEENGDRGTKRKRATEDISSQEPAEKKVAGLEGAADGASATEATGGTTQAPKPFRPAFRILDALSATGLRALRYAKELPFATHVTSNDLSPNATESVKMNITHNGLEKIINPITGDANVHMYSLLGNQPPIEPGVWHGKYDVIDLDPYGTAGPFLDSAVQAVTDGGLLCVTCTDAGVWASNGYPEKAYALYGGVPIKGPHSHEVGLRLILNAISLSASKYGLAIDPLLSLSIDFYARVFVRVYKAPAQVKFAASKSMVVYNCDSGCGAWTTQPLLRAEGKQNKRGDVFHKFGFSQGPSAAPRCEYCGYKTHLAGPMWGGAIQNPAFAQRILDLLPTLDPETYQTIPRIEGMVTVAMQEELDLPVVVPEDAPDALAPPIPRNPDAHFTAHPFYFLLDNISKKVNVQTPSADAFRGALKGMGYRVTRSHTKPSAIRTDAPWEVIWKVIIAWRRQSKTLAEGASETEEFQDLKEGSPGRALIEKFVGLSNEGQPQVEGIEKMVQEAIEQGMDAYLLRAKLNAMVTKALQRKSASFKGDEAEKRDLEIVFDEKLGREKDAKKLVRYQMNPRANWGPIARASGGN